MSSSGKVRGLNLCLAVVLILSVIALAGCGNHLPKPGHPQHFSVPGFIRFRGKDRRVQ